MSRMSSILDRIVQFTLKLLATERRKFSHYTKNVVAILVPSLIALDSVDCI